MREGVRIRENEGAGAQEEKACLLRAERRREAGRRSGGTSAPVRPIHHFLFSDRRGKQTPDESKIIPFTIYNLKGIILM